MNPKVKTEPTTLPALVMAGGKGTRLRGTREKPLIPILGKPMLQHVLEALQRARKIHHVTVAVTPRTPNTAQLAASFGAHIVKTPGHGYIQDLRTALQETGTPTLTVTADLPTLTPKTIDTLVTLHTTHPEPSTSYWVPKTLVQRLGLTTWGRHEEEIAGEPAHPTGVNVVGDIHPTPERRFLIHDPSIACNVNTKHDLEIAEGVMKWLKRVKCASPNSSTNPS